jgi:hypothetical protein
MFTITAEWLEQNKTSAGAYSKQQLKVLGIDWPPRKGWQKRVVGTEIRDTQSLQFEAAAVVKTPLERCLDMIKKLSAEDLQVVSEACNASISFRKNKG